MSPDLATYLALLTGYLAVAGGVFFWIWRASRRRIARIGFRLALRAFVLAFLFAPGAVACGGATIVPFALVVVATSIGLISPNGCGTHVPWLLGSFLVTFAAVAIALYILDRHRHRGDAL
jgi:hypothetical protein